MGTFLFFCVIHDILLHVLVPFSLSLCVFVLVCVVVVFVGVLWEVGCSFLAGYDGWGYTAMQFETSTKPFGPALVGIAGRYVLCAL